MSISSDELASLEASLRNFILKEKSNSTSFDDASSFNLMKYRGLSLTLDYRNPENPMFVVHIAALEAYFSMSNGTKETGSLGGDERYVYKWYMFGNVQEKFVASANSAKNKKTK